MTENRPKAGPVDRRSVKITLLLGEEKPIKIQLRREKLDPGGNTDLVWTYEDFLSASDADLLGRKLIAAVQANAEYPFTDYSSDPKTLDLPIFTRQPPEVKP